MLSTPPVSNAIEHAELAQAESKLSVARRVRVELRRSGYAGMRRVEVDLDGGVLILSGLVYSFHMKQVAQEIALKTAQGVTIENRLTVAASPGHSPK